MEMQFAVAFNTVLQHEKIENVEIKFSFSTSATKVYKKQFIFIYEILRENNVNAKEICKKN